MASAPQMRGSEALRVVISSTPIDLLKNAQHPAAVAFSRSLGRFEPHICQRKQVCVGKRPKVAQGNVNEFAGGGVPDASTPKPPVARGVSVTCKTRW